MAKSSKKQSEKAMEGVSKRIQGMGYTQDQVEQTLKYMRDTAPITINFSASNGFLKLINFFMIQYKIVMKFFVKDTHYRNQFETRSSGGCLSEPTRVGWEDRLFNKIYHHAGYPLLL